MEFQSVFPIWGRLSAAQQARILGTLMTRTARKGTVLHHGSMDCAGLLLIQTGQLRAYIRSDEGREITIYRLLERDMCLLSASCMLRSIQFEVTIEAEKDTELWIIPTDTYKQLMDESAAVANYTNELMASRFSDVMWLMEQILWRSLDKRLAAFLLEESAIEGGDTLKEDGYPDVQIFMRTFREMESVVEQYNRDLPSGNTKSAGNRQPPLKNSIDRPKSRAC